jgi:hypothetical protein
MDGEIGGVWLVKEAGFEIFSALLNFDVRSDFAQRPSIASAPPYEYALFR